MSVCLMPTQEQEIAEVRVRRAWNGRLVVQIRRKLRRATFRLLPDKPTAWEDAGLSTWRDANGNNAAETAEVVLKMRTLNFEPF